MSKHKIAWLPGDGVGNDVMECALFGAIISKPRDEAAEELDPELQDKGKVRTYDMGGNDSSLEVAETIAKNL